MAIDTVLPAWAKWQTNPALDPWTVGIEEEVMLLEPDGSPSWRSEDVLQALPPELAEHAPARTGGGGRGLPGRPLSVPAPVAARARSPRADVRPARARGRAGPRA